MSKITFLLKSCIKKKRFNYTQATKIAEKYNQRVYYCKICCGYHLTSQLEKNT